MPERFLTVDGNEAAASVAYRTNEVIAIYPITPASPMGELSDAWSAAGRKNVYGAVPTVIEMQSEGGAAGAVHGALQGGALTTTFTASQGLLLMIPNMFKIAGELSPCVIHVAARSIATHALSIFGDHSDVMAARSTGWAMLCSSDVQEAQDFALIAQALTLESRVPVSCTSSTASAPPTRSRRSRALSDDDLRALIWTTSGSRRTARARWTRTGRSCAAAPRTRTSSSRPARPQPVLRRGPRHRCSGAMQRFAERTGRRYAPVEYHGHPEAERVVVLMGSGAGAAREAVRASWSATARRSGVAVVRLYRPFPSAELGPRCRPPPSEAIAVLDRTKEPGAVGEPLYQDVVTALVEAGGEAWRSPR